MPVCPSYEKLAEVLDECTLAKSRGTVLLNAQDVEDIVNDLIRCRQYINKQRRPIVPRPPGFDRAKLEAGEYSQDLNKEKP